MDYLGAAQDFLLRESGMTAERIRAELARSARELDGADAYIQKRAAESWQLEDGIVKGGAYTTNSGIGLRAVHGETTAYASSDAIHPSALSFWNDIARAAKTGAANSPAKLPTPAPPESAAAAVSSLSEFTRAAAPSSLSESAHAAASSLRGSAAPRAAAAPSSPEFATPPPSLYSAAAAAPLYSDAAPRMDTAKKIALLKKMDATLRREDDVENVTVSLAASHEVVLIITPDGAIAADYRPMVRLDVQAVVVEGDKREAGHAAVGGRCDYDLFDDAQAMNLCAKALADAREKLSAQAAPAGRMPVVLGNGWAGVLLHEAVGHGLEADFNRKNLSAFSGRIGQKVAADGVTVIDAGNIAARRGSLNCDDEGAPTQETVLIENGILRGYLQDATNARLMRSRQTGNGRRESYAHAPMPRMTNTFMPAGQYAANEIIASVQDGIYAQDFNGGEVDITNGNFVFVASKARLIKNGKLGAVVKGATIVGNGPAIMPLVSMVGDDFALDPGVGTCGKDGQWVPVGVGQPTLKIDAITVGGTQV